MWRGKTGRQAERHARKIWAGVWAHSGTRGISYQEKEQNWSAFSPKIDQELKSLPIWWKEQIANMKTHMKKVMLGFVSSKFSMCAFQHSILADHSGNSGRHHVPLKVYWLTFHFNLAQYLIHFISINPIDLLSALGFCSYCVSLHVKSKVQLLQKRAYREGSHTLSGSVSISDSKTMQQGQDILISTLKWEIQGAQNEYLLRASPSGFCPQIRSNRTIVFLPQCLCGWQHNSWNPRFSSLGYFFNNSCRNSFLCRRNSCRSKQQKRSHYFAGNLY